ncbi:MAG: hypothetical protein DIU69_08520 [Bacillota bacterium]|nr:MAG: hypothetical protein DIU69_08520 [Bacillota bacterium]
MRALRIVVAAGVVAGLLLYGGFSVLAAGSDGVAGRPDTGDKVTGPVAGPLVLAYLAGKTGKSPAELRQAVRDDGLEAVLEAAGVSASELRAVLAGIREVRAAGFGHGRHGARFNAVVAQALAELSGKPLDEIRQLRRKLGDWRQVMDRLGLKPAEVRAKVRELLRERAGTRTPAEPGNHGNEPATPQAGAVGASVGAS